MHPSGVPGLPVGWTHQYGPGDGLPTLGSSPFDDISPVTMCALGLMDAVRVPFRGHHGEADTVRVWRVSMPAPCRLAHYDPRAGLRPLGEDEFGSISDPDTHSLVDVASRGGVKGAGMVEPSATVKEAPYATHDDANIREDEGFGTAPVARVA